IRLLAHPLILSPTLAGPAPRRRPPVDHPAGEQLATPLARLPPTAVALEVELVGAGAAVGRPVVPQRGPTVLDPGAEHVDEGSVEVGGSGSGEGAGPRVDPREPERLVGVDVADAGHRPLAQQLGLQPGPAAAQRLPEVVGLEPVVEWLGP